MVVPVVDEGMGRFEAADQRDPRHRQQQCRPEQQADARQLRRQPVAGPIHGPRGEAQQRPRGHRVDPQIGHEPQVVPGRHLQAIPVPAERSVHGQVAPPEREVAVVVPAGEFLDDLVVGLRRHDHQHPEGQRQQQPPGTATEEPGRPLREQEGGGRARDQEQQRQSPGRAEHHQRLQRFAGMRAFDVPVPAHVVHAAVIEHEQGEGGDADPVQVEAALHGSVSMWEDASVSADAAVSTPKCLIAMEK